MSDFIKTYWSIMLMVVIASCSGEFRTYDLANDFMTGLHVKASNSSGESKEVELKKGVPAKGYYRGDLLGGAIWWARKGVIIDKEEDFIVIADSVGPAEIPFGATFPPLDFAVDKVMIKVTARAESQDGADLELALQLHDGNGFVTNKKRPTVIIKNTEDTDDYYFLLDDVFEQEIPVKKQVNGGFINSIQLFINPAGEPFSGKIYIDELRVVESFSN